MNEVMSWQEAQEIVEKWRTNIKGNEPFHDLTIDVKDLFAVIDSAKNRIEELDLRLQISEDYGAQNLTNSVNWMIKYKHAVKDLFAAIDIGLEGQLDVRNTGKAIRNEQESEDMPSKFQQRYVYLLEAPRELRGGGTWVYDTREEADKHAKDFGEDEEHKPIAIVTKMALRKRYHRR